jgi:hypothetical protein
LWTITFKNGRKINIRIKEHNRNITEKKRILVNIKL